METSLSIEKALRELLARNRKESLSKTIKKGLQEKKELDKNKKKVR